MIDFWLAKFAMQWTKWACDLGLENIEHHLLVEWKVYPKVFHLAKLIICVAESQNLHL